MRELPRKTRLKENGSGSFGAAIAPNRRSHRAARRRSSFGGGVWLRRGLRRHGFGTFGRGIGDFASSTRSIEMTKNCPNSQMGPFRRARAAGGSSFGAGGRARSVAGGVRSVAGAV